MENPACPHDVHPEGQGHDTLLITVDPGYDEVAVCAFRLPPGVSPAQRHHHLVYGWLFEPPPPPSDRLYWVARVGMSLVEHVADHVAGCAATVVAVEEPPYAGTNPSLTRRQRGKQPIAAQSLAKFHVARGVLLGALYATGGASVLSVPAAGSKARRLLAVAAALPRNDRRRQWLCRAGGRGALNPHLADACALAWVVPLPPARSAQ